MSPTGSFAEWAIYISIIVLSMLFRLAFRKRPASRAPVGRSRQPGGYRISGQPDRSRIGALPVLTSAAGTHASRQEAQAAGGAGETDREAETEGPGPERLERLAPGTAATAFDESFWRPDEASGSLRGPAMMEGAVEQEGVSGGEGMGGPGSEEPSLEEWEPVEYGPGAFGARRATAAGAAGPLPGPPGAVAGAVAGAPGGARWLDAASVVEQALAQGSGLISAVVLSEVLGPPRGVSWRRVGARRAVPWGSRR